LTAAALRFPLRDPAIGAILLGAGNAAEIADCVARLSEPIPEGFWSEADAALWEYDREVR
jgi:hypothetical protein